MSRLGLGHHRFKGRAASVQVMEHREPTLQLTVDAEKQLREVAIEMGFKPDHLLEQLVRAFLLRRRGLGQRSGLLMEVR